MSIKAKNEGNAAVAFINGGFSQAEKYIRHMLQFTPENTRRYCTTGYSSKCAVDWISASNESNLSGQACVKHRFLLSSQTQQRSISEKFKATTVSSVPGRNATSRFANCSKDLIQACVVHQKVKVN